MSRMHSEDTATQAMPLKLFRGATERRHAERMKQQLAELESELMAQLSFASEVVDAPARYLAEAGGKRVRPMLTLLTSELGQGPNELVRRSAVAIEMTHLASLYHDDVMDDARLRRGVPAAQTVWSNSVAILAGDLLFARASTLVSGLGEEAIMLQARTFERLCLGQLHETLGPQAGEDPMQHYLQVLADKTGALIATAARVGVMFSEAPAQYADPVTEYGEKVGVAFQLVDDVIDLSPKAEQTGKLAGTDLRAGVVTMPMLLLRQRAAAGDAAAASLSERIDAGVARIAQGADPALLDPEVIALREHEVTAETTRAARQWAQEAVAALAPLPKGPVKNGLKRLAESIVTREG